MTLITKASPFRKAFTSNSRQLTSFMNI